MSCLTSTGSGIWVCGGGGGFRTEDDIMSVSPFPSQPLATQHVIAIVSLHDQTTFHTIQWQQHYGMRIASATTAAAAAAQAYEYLKTQLN